MLGLVAAQLKFKTENKELKAGKAVWVDVRSFLFPTVIWDVADNVDWRRDWVSTIESQCWSALTRYRYNIEAMSAFLPVNEFFSHVYLVDLSPSLCQVARERFERLGWKNVSVVCQDARSFRLPEADSVDPRMKSTPGADLITMSYSLSMIPDYYSVVDSLPSLLKPSGVLGVCDFYGWYPRC